MRWAAASLLLCCTTTCPGRVSCVKLLMSLERSTAKKPVPSYLQIIFSTAPQPFLVDTSAVPRFQCLQFILSAAPHPLLEEFYPNLLSSDWPPIPASSLPLQAFLAAANRSKDCPKALNAAQLLTQSFMFAGHLLRGTSASS